MNKKAITAALFGIGITAGTLIHGYFDIMARESKFKSPIAFFAEKINSDDSTDFCNFTLKKLEWIKKQNTEKIEIKSKRNERLAGFLTYPKSESNVFVLFAHGYHTDHNGDPANFLQYYVEQGYNFLAVDHIASGESEGRFVGFDYFETDDCLQWLDYLINRFGDDIKIIIHGVSMGGATVCQMVSRVPNQVKLAIADCPYTSAAEEFNETVKNACIKNYELAVNIFNRINKTFAKYDLRDTDVRKSVQNTKVPMLFVHGNDDTFVPTRMGIELFKLCTAQKDILLVDGAKHAECIRVDEAGYHKKLNEFINKYLGVD